jgi:hypothetical protein
MISGSIGIWLVHCIIEFLQRNNINERLILRVVYCGFFPDVLFISTSVEFDKRYIALILKRLQLTVCYAAAFFMQQYFSTLKDDNYLENWRDWN